MRLDELFGKKKKKSSIIDLLKSTIDECLGR